MQPEGMLALMKWDGETPYMYFFKHGLDEEKVVSSFLILFLILINKIINISIFILGLL